MPHVDWDDDDDVMVDNKKDGVREQMRVLRIEVDRGGVIFFIGFKETNKGLDAIIQGGQDMLQMLQ